MAARKGKESLLLSTPSRTAGSSGGGSGSGGGGGGGAASRLKRFLHWAGRSGFFFLAAAAFMSSMSLVAFRARGLELDAGRATPVVPVLPRPDCSLIVYLYWCSRTQSPRPTRTPCRWVAIVEGEARGCLTWAYTRSLQSLT